MSSSLLSTISPSTIDSAVRPIREGKKTPKAATLPRKTPASTRKTKSVIPLSLPPPFSLELESDGVGSPIDHLLVMCQQAIPFKPKTALLQLENEENALPVETGQVSNLVTLLTAKPQPSRGQKRKLTKVMPVAEPIMPSSVETPMVSSPENSATPTLISILNDSPAASTPESNDVPTTPSSSPPVLTSILSGDNAVQGKRKSPPVHLNSECSNCGTRETTLWRRNEEGSIECNSCSLYFKKNGIKRPITLQNRVIFKRQRKSSSESIEKNEIKEDKMIDNENIAPM